MNNKQTGAKISTKFVALSLAVVLGASSIGVGTVNCANNNPTKGLCLTAKIEHMIMGYDAALEHEARDLAKRGAFDIVYEENPCTVVVIPEGYIYENGQAVRYIEPRSDGTIPEGYSLVEVNGIKLLRKEAKGELKMVGPSVSYKIEEDGIVYSNRIYYDKESGEYKTLSMVISLGNNDVITYCNPDAIKDDYVYVVDNHGKSVPVRFGESTNLPEDGTIDETYQAGDSDYEFARVVVFYSDTANPGTLANNYSSRLEHGDTMVLVSQGEGKTIFAVYSKILTNTKHK